MFPILKTEYCNARYVKQMLLGENVDANEFDSLNFKEGKRPERPGGGEANQPDKKEELKNENQQNEEG